MFNFMCWLVLVLAGYQKVRGINSRWLTNAVAKSGPAGFHQMFRIHRLPQRWIKVASCFI
jgi:hypothetical protein